MFLVICLIPALPRLPQELCETYKEKYGNSLMDDIYSETGGTYRAMLMYKFRRAQTGLLHVPRKKLIRCDDMPSDFPIDDVHIIDIISGDSHQHHKR